ncbi:MAG: hypothetical protein LBO00_08755 [Zoogloeaceae bacterium]|jgi:hypothetical protein|nr:hypothetical protein [Zoogloeaceae bacterium]
MNDFFAAYLFCWISACLVAVGIFVRRAGGLEITRRAYWRFLLRPWKLITFAIASLGLMGIAPYTGDMTWDAFDAAFMSALTFATAPWAVGVLYRTLRGQASLAAAYVAACAWMFSASWSYDLYLLLRDGAYPETWAANIGASSILYCAAGLLWNLEDREGWGVIFAFMAEPWPPDARADGFARVVWFALPFMLLAGIAILSFVW